MRSCWQFRIISYIQEKHISMVSCQKGLICHAYAWQIGPFWQDTLDMRLNSVWQLISNFAVSIVPAAACTGAVMTKFKSRWYSNILILFPINPACVWMNGILGQIWHSSISGIVGLIYVKLKVKPKTSKSIGYWANYVTIPFDHTLELGIEF